MISGRMVDAYSNIQTLKLFGRDDANDRYMRDGFDIFQSTILRFTRLLTTLRACYEAVKCDPPSALEAMQALLVPPLLALTHSDGGLGSWQGSGAVSADRLSALVLASVVFTALTLLIGDPFYQRIWRAVETDLGGVVPTDDGSMRVAFAESLRLVVLGALVALLALLLGLIPVVGAAVAAVTSILLTGRLLAREITGRALNARDVTSRDRSRLFAANRARLLGFGAATQLCFMVPLGAVFVMPTAVAGGTLLARDLLERPSAAAPVPAPTAAPTPPEVPGA